MVKKYQVSTSGITEDFILKIWEAQSDGVGAEIYQTTLVEKNGSGVPTLGAGHQVIETVTVNGLDKVVHILRMYGVTSGNLYHEFNDEPTTEIVQVFLPIQFKIGDGGPNTPAADQNQATTPELIGLKSTEFIIHRNNYGVLKEGTHFTFDGSPIVTSGTGYWELISPDVFGANEEFTIQRLPKAVTTVVNDSVVGKWFGPTMAGGNDIFVNISANTNYSNAHLRKLIRFQGAFTYSFLVTDVIPIGYAFCFQNFSNSASNATVVFGNGTLLWAGSPKASIAIPQYTEACFVWDGTNWNVVYLNTSAFANGATTPPGTILKVGEQAQGDIPAGDPQILITHNANITGDYQVFVTFRNNNPAAYAANNKICWSWHHHTDSNEKKNKFWLTPQEVSSEGQSVTICYMLVKT